MPRKTSRKSKSNMGKRVSRKSMSRSKGKKRVSRKSMKRKGTKRGSRKKMKPSKVKKVSNILASSYGLAGMYKDVEKGYKGQRVAKKDAYKYSKKKKLSKTASLPSQSSNSFLDGIQSKSKSKGSWLSHVKKVWEQGKSTPGYKYKNAMQDAKKTW